MKRKYIISKNRKKLSFKPAVTLKNGDILNLEFGLILGPRGATYFNDKSPVKINVESLPDAKQPL